MTVEQKLASLATADRVEVAIDARPSKVASSVTIKDALQIARLLALLEPSPQAPSGGMHYALLAFFHADERTNEVWVYVGGDWGFTGGGGTVGRNAGLVPFLREHVSLGM